MAPTITIDVIVNDDDSLTIKALGQTRTLTREKDSQDWLVFYMALVEQYPELAPRFKEAKNE